jgi:hypothetical protein
MYNILRIVSRKLKSGSRIQMGTRKWDLLNRMMSTGVSDLGVTSESKLCIVQREPLPLLGCKLTC